MPADQIFKTNPEFCEACRNKIKNVFYDAKLRAGPWGNFCPSCFEKYCLGTGTGLGQKYVQQEDTGQFMKVNANEIVRNEVKDALDKLLGI